MSKKLSMLKARDIMRVLHLMGEEIRQSGSHIFFAHQNEVQR